LPISRGHFGTLRESFCYDANFAAGQPEQGRYRARFVDNDVPVGDWSDTVEVTAHP
jgi:hypothetical protein